MRAQHTPGPWRYWAQRRPLAEDTCTFRNSDNAEVLRAVTLTLTEADARLVAAAPELLETLEACEQCISNLPALGGVDYSFMKRVRAAIAKATGAPHA